MTLSTLFVRQKRFRWIAFGVMATLTGLLGIMLPQDACAVAEEEPAGSAATDKAAAVEKAALEISEVPIELYAYGENAAIFRQRVASIGSYIQRYNRHLSFDEVSNIAQAIVQHSGRYGVDYRLLTSLIAIESAFRQNAISSSGAIGMGQLKPDTARWLGVMNPYDPVDNIAGTARFLSWLVRRYNGNLEYALSAYYQGPGSVDRNGVTPVCMPYLEKVNRALGPLM